MHVRAGARLVVRGGGVVSVASLAASAIWRLFSVPEASSIIISGEVSEWFKVLLSKSSVGNSHRGFESHPLRRDSVTVDRYRET